MGKIGVVGGADLVMYCNHVGGIASGFSVDGARGGSNISARVGSRAVCYFDTDRQGSMEGRAKSCRERLTSGTRYFDSEREKSRNLCQ